MGKIKVGKYVRTKHGEIGVITKINPSLLDFNLIVKHSKNIEDLIGYGDFINGKMCIDIEYYTRADGTEGINFVCLGGCVLKEEIKNIATKERFMSIVYKIEE